MRGKKQINRETVTLLVFGVYLILFIFIFLLNDCLRINTDLLVLVAWGIFLFLLFRYQIEFVIKYSYIFYIVLFNLLGVFVVENTTLYLKELRIYSSHQNSFLLIAFIHWLFINMMLFFEKYVGQKVFKFSSRVREKWIWKDDCTRRIIKIIGWMLLLIVLFLFLNVSGHSAASLGMDRFQFSQTYIQGITGRIGARIPYLLPIIPLLFIHKEKKLGIAVLLVYSFYQYWIGNKSGTFLTIAYLMVPALILGIGNKKINYKKIIWVILGIIVIIFLMVFSLNSRTYGKNTEENMEYFYQRIAQQGQIWWAVFTHEKGEPAHYNEFSDEYRNWFSMDETYKEKYDFGIYKMMRKVTPQEVFENKVKNGSRYSAATNASIYYYFREPGLIIAALIGAFLFSVFLNIYWGALAGRKILAALIFGRFLNILFSLIGMADYDVFFSLKKAALILIVILWDLLFEVRDRREAITNMTQKSKIERNHNENTSSYSCQGRVQGNTE